MIHNLSTSFSAAAAILAELRDLNKHEDRARFRYNIERMGEIIAYEISKEWPMKEQQVTTPLGIASCAIYAEQPVLATILRAGLPLQTGMARVFDQADLAYISAFRKHTDEHQFEIVLEYVASPAIDDRILILCDPMLATGQSLVSTYKEFCKKGKPKKVYLVSVVGSEQGVAFATQSIPEADLWIGAIDPELNKDGYIVPGLGDAGDLSFGVKL